VLASGYSTFGKPRLGLVHGDAAFNLHELGGSTLARDLGLNTMKSWFDVVGMSILSRSMHSAGTKIIEFFADGYKLKAETSSFKLLIGRLFFPMAVYEEFCK